MRDYKNVKVPKTYRVAAKAPKGKRSAKRRDSGRPGRGKTGIRAQALRVLTIIVMAATVWLAWWGYGVITHAKMFAVAAVDVEGASHASKADLKAIADEITGRNIFQVDLGAAVNQARALTWVKEARFYRRLPDRVGVVLTERNPAVILDTGKGRYLMDRSGVVIDGLKQSDEAAWQLPVVAVRGSRVRPGEQVASEALAEAFSLIDEITARGGWKLAGVTITADTPESISVFYADHEFRMGSGNYDEKFRRLAEVLSDVQRRNLDFAYVDLRPERQAAVMVKDEKKH